MNALKAILTTFIFENQSTSKAAHPDVVEDCGFMALPATRMHHRDDTCIRFLQEWTPLVL